MPKVSMSSYSCFSADCIVATDNQNYGFISMEVIREQITLAFNDRVD